jgi:hypothetical protein
VTNLNLDGGLKSLASLLLASIGLGAHDATTPLSLGLLVLLGVTLLDGLDELGELRLVLRADLGDGEDGGGLLVDDRAETGLALDDGVWDTHLAAESWEEDNQLDWVNIVRDEDESSLLVLNQANNVVETVLDSVRLLRDILLLLALSDGGSLLDETLLLLGLGLWAVLVEELESLRSGVAVEDVLELGNCWWDLQAKVEDLLLALKTDILWPSNHAGQVALWLDGLTDAMVASALLNERVLRILANLSTHCKIRIVRRTFAGFLAELAFPCGNGAAATRFGGCH